MAISTTTILGTDSISASRLTINDNFTVVKDEINSIETYVNPSTATVSGLTLLETSKLTVGPTSSPNLQLTTSAFDINMATTFKKTITQKQYGIFDNFYSTGTTYALKASTNSNAYTMLSSSSLPAACRSTGTISHFGGWWTKRSITRPSWRSSTRSRRRRRIRTKAGIRVASSATPWCRRNL